MEDHTYPVSPCCCLSARCPVTARWKDGTLWRGGAYPPFSWTDASGEIKDLTSILPTPCAQQRWRQVQAVGPGLGRHDPGPAVAQ